MIKKLLLPLLLLPVLTCFAIEFNPIWYKMPPGSHHLNPAIFLSEPLFIKLQTLGITEGSPVLVKNGERNLELRVYSSLRTENTFSMNQENGKKLNLRSGSNKLQIEKLSPTQASLPFRPLTPLIEAYNGDNQNWQGYALGAPHGDCDWFTGEIAQIFTQLSKIPSIAVYGCRFPYRGIWYDCNRPLTKPAANRTGISGISVENFRIWTPKSHGIYSAYQQQVFELADTQPHNRLTFLTSLHGHDLSVYLNNGRTVSKNVIEGMGIGFSKDQLRSIKKFYKKEIKKYFPNAAPLYFGNLPEDKSFYVQGKKSYFLYSAAGTRLTGTLQADRLKYGLHLETPNSLRVKVTSRKKLAAFLAELYTFTDTLIKTPKKQLCLPEIKDVQEVRPKQFVQSSFFQMGSALVNAWDNEKPQHQVFLDDFYLDRYEVTTAQYSKFLNLALSKKLIFVDGGVVYDSHNKTNVILKTSTSAPLSQIHFRNRIFSYSPEYANHPVVHVSYYGAKLFAHFYQEQLPTEAQWEKAASWNPQTKIKYKYANQSNQIINKANIEDSQDPYEISQVGTSPVGFFTATSFYGTFDMSGNVWEWTSNYYDDEAYRKRTQQVTYNPDGPQQGSMKTVRGGAWNFEYNAARTTMRLGVNPNFTSVNIGFRCARNGQK